MQFHGGNEVTLALYRGTALPCDTLRMIADLKCDVQQIIDQRTKKGKKECSSSVSGRRRLYFIGVYTGKSPHSPCEQSPAFSFHTGRTSSQKEGRRCETGSVRNAKNDFENGYVYSFHSARREGNMHSLQMLTEQKSATCTEPPAAMHLRASPASVPIKVESTPGQISRSTTMVSPPAARYFSVV